jgi:hypothetical protein
MSLKYDYIGHSTTLYAAGDTADGFDVYEITTVHGPEEDWDTIAFCPDEDHAKAIAQALILREPLTKALTDLVNAWPNNETRSEAIRNALCILAHAEKTPVL